MEGLMRLNHGFGPTTEERQNRSFYPVTLAGGITVVLRLLYHMCFGVKPVIEEFVEDSCVSLEFLSAVIAGEMLRRMVLYFEEMYHVKERYLGSNVDAFSSCVSVSSNKILVLSVFGFSSFIYIQRLASKSQFMLLPQYVCAALVSSFVMQFLGLRKLSAVELSDLSEKQIKNVAVGLAWSYYFGYLNLIFPDWEGMINRAVKDDFALEGEDLRDKLASRKVFIIIPKSCYCYNTFTQVDQSIKFQTSMPDNRIARGGVQERVYKNSLYKIQTNDNEQATYVMMEYATPLLTMFDMVKKEGASFSKEDLNTQVVIFYNTLKKILENDKTCIGKYHLVLVSDEAQRNLSGVIRQTIKEERLNI